jgi:DNA (cytosine-5)-methyltransferase 1
MNHLDLFTGIGAFSIAAQRNGINTLYHSEINEQANKVLAKNFPKIPGSSAIRDWLRPQACPSGVT